MNSEMKTTEPATALLDQAIDQAHEATALRSQLANSRRQHAALLRERDERLCEGVDVLPEVRKLHLEIEALPSQISRLEQAARRAASQFVDECNIENSRRAGAAYMRNRDNLREALQLFRAALASVAESMRQGATEGAASIEPINARLAEIERVLNSGPMPRTVFRLNPLPPIDSERVSRGELLAAIDAWIKGLY